MTAAPHRPAAAPPAGVSPPGPRRSLILAGGGMRVAYQAGVLRALVEHGLTFAHADGTSGGTINLAMLCSGLSIVEMCDRWRTLRVGDFVSLLPFHEYVQGPNLPAMGDADGIVEKVFPHLGIDVARINAVEGMAATFNVCNFTRKTNEAIPHDAIDRDLLVAGISLPIFMPPVAKGGALYLDAVWIKDANLMEAVRRGAEELWLVWCIGNTGAYARGMFRQYVHMIELSANGALFEEFDRIKDINARIERGERVYGQSRPIRLHVIKPDYPLPLDPDLFFGRIDTATLIDMGYADAARYLATMEDGGVPFEPEATKMQDEVLGLTFSETMAGGFALGERDPVAGEKKGRVAGTELAMHATIHLRDVRRFAADPAHAGTLTGHVDFPPLGTHLPASGGVFNLFSPTGQPKLKLMVYELAFSHEGKPYYLAGKKEVRDDPGFDLWTDTTTLYTTLHEGSNKDGPIVGAGVLHLGVKDLARLVSTMRATGADGLIESAEAIAIFGRLFLGQLWESYARMAGK